MSAPQTMNFIEASFEQAQMALKNQEVPIGCVIVRGDEVIASGYNQPNKTKNATLHAEIVAMANIPFEDLRDCQLYVTVEPCIMCAAALRKVGLTCIFFGCKNERFGGCGSVMSAHNDRRLKDPVLEIQLYDTVYPNDYELRAVILLRQFYLLENTKAPNPKAKKDRVLRTTL